MLSVPQKFVFKHGDKEVTATKTTKLYHVAGGNPECELGTTYKYQVWKAAASST
jgi:hypothetical protein